MENPILRQQYNRSSSACHRVLVSTNSQPPNQLDLKQLSLPLIDPDAITVLTQLLYKPSIHFIQGFTSAHQVLEDIPFRILHW